MHNRLILKTILQKNIVLKLVRYLASSPPMTSSIKKAFRGSIVWYSGVEKFEPLELVSCRDELHKIFKFPISGTNAHVVIKKKIKNLAGTHLSARDEFHWNGTGEIEMEKKKIGCSIEMEQVIEKNWLELVSARDEFHWNGTGDRKKLHWNGTGEILLMTKKKKKIGWNGGLNQMQGFIRTMVILWFSAMLD